MQTVTSIATATSCPIRLAAPPCSLGITDGSERGDYVPQSHLLSQIGRPHHVVNLMFQYYPDLAGWPTQGVKWRGFYRNAALNKGDGYFPLVLEEGGAWGRLYLSQIADVRAHGQEPQLTLTLHADTPDETLIRIAESLKPYGRMRLRINHECNGVWFYFNQRWSYRQVNDFFIRFHNILHRHAPEARTVACWNGPGDAWNQPDTAGNRRGHLTDDELAPMFRTADIVSFDQYASLHYGWPNPGFDPRHPSESFRLPFEVWWKLLEDFHALIAKVRGPDVRVEVHEVNEDADLAGFDGQADWITRFYREVLARRLPWLTNVTFYMFRDRGGLGLEQEDVEYPQVFRELPSLRAYRSVIQDPYFGLLVKPDPSIPAPEQSPWSWVSPQEASGREYTFMLPYGTRQLNLRLPRGRHLLIEAGNRWFVKPAKVERLPLAINELHKSFTVRLFAPPPDGKNNRAQAFETALPAPPVIEL